MPDMGPVRSRTERWSVSYARQQYVSIPKAAVTRRRRVFRPRRRHGGSARLASPAPSSWIRFSSEGTTWLPHAGVKDILWGYGLDDWDHTKHVKYGSMVLKKTLCVLSRVPFGVELKKFRRWRRWVAEGKLTPVNLRSVPVDSRRCHI